MKYFLFILTCLFLFSCTYKKNIPTPTRKEVSPRKITKTEFQTILDSADINGAILIFDPAINTYYSNDFIWSKKGQLPASTFKIPNSIIALETGVVENDSTLFKWDGKKRAFKIWERDLTFGDAFKYSCVPCFQEIARDIGVNRMKEYLNKLDYGNIQVDSTNLDLFWLTGVSKISPFHEIDFLKRFYTSKLPIAKRTENLVKKIMILNENPTYKLYGKTGWTSNGNHNNGWFVGFIETKNKIFYFATNIEPNSSFDMTLFSKIRKEVTYQALMEMNIIDRI